MPKLERIYLDHAASAPIHSAAKMAFMEGMDRWANPSSPHLDGRDARALMENARTRMKEALNWDGDIIITGGASEAINMVFNRAKVDRYIVSPMEHDAVLRAGKGSAVLAVDLDGNIVAESVKRALASEAAGESKALVAVQSVNNETGLVQDLDRIGSIVRDTGGVFFADCAQSAGKIPLPDADFISISGHKFGGPPGVGALLVRDLALIEATGGQEKGYRTGTENLPAVLSMAAALETSKSWLERAADLRGHLDKAIKAAGGEIVAEHSKRIETISGYRMPGVAASAQLIQFDMAGISVSAGSACSSGTLKASHVLTAMGWDEKAAGEVVRVSIGPETSRAHIYRFLEVWQSMFARAKQNAGAAA